MAAKNFDNVFVEQIKQTVESYKRTHSQRDTAKELGVNQSTVKRRLDIASEYGIDAFTDTEIVVETVRLAKQKQGLQDRQRIERKSFREHARIENAVAEYQKEIRDILTSFQFSVPEYRTPSNTPACGIIHWSDQHLNERVDLPHNQFDWNVAARRLKKHVDRCKQICKAYGITSVLIAMTGDLLNSDRRLDELLSNAGNRAKASVLAVDLYSQAIVDLAQDLDITVAAISGNESRVTQDIGWVAETASDNYDFAIFEMLRLMLGEKISFVVSKNPSEIVVNVAGQNVLMIHGHGAITKNTQESVQSIKGRYLANGVRVDFVIWGHIHEALIADQYARSSSLVGANTYAEHALNLSGRASQNFYVMHKGGGFDGIKIDLQNTDDVDGYNIQSRLEAYNTKSVEKCRQPQTIFQVVI
jgi:predicted phosphodiesterase/DNA-binding MarR family transcriptional regulator